MLEVLCPQALPKQHPSLCLQPPVFPMEKIIHDTLCADLNKQGQIIHEVPTVYLLLKLHMTGTVY